MTAHYGFATDPFETLFATIHLNLTFNDYES